MAQSDAAAATEKLVGFADRIVGVALSPMVAVDEHLRIIAANQAFRDLAECPGVIDGQSLLELQDGRWDLPAFRSALERALSEDRGFDRHILPGSAGRELLVNGRALQPDDGDAGLILLSFGIASIGGSVILPPQRDGVQAGMLVVELAHRVKNLLAIVQSLAMQTRGPDVETFRKTLLARLKALALAHGALLETSLQKAPLRGLLHELMAPFLMDDPGRVVMDGPAVSLPAGQVAIFALIVHELASNAARHGALSTAEGRILVNWQKVDDGLRLEWRERGGPAGSALEEGRGFGTTLIRRAASYQLRGTAELSLDDEGFVCSLTFPWKDAA